TSMVTVLAGEVSWGRLLSARRSPLIPPAAVPTPYPQARTLSPSSQIITDVVAELQNQISPLPRRLIRMTLSRRRLPSRENRNCMSLARSLEESVLEPRHLAGGEICGNDNVLDFIVPMWCGHQRQR